MKFEWTEEGKEIFYQRAERILEDAGIDFVHVDRSQFGAQGLDMKNGTANKVYVYLNGYPFKDLTRKKRNQLKKLEKWEIVEKKTPRFRDRPVYMESRFVFEDTEEEDAEQWI